MKARFIQDQIVENATRSKWVIGILLFILIANFFLPDPIPFIDEIVTIPLIIVLFGKLIRIVSKAEHNAKKSKDKKEQIIDPENEDIIEGEIVDE